MTSEPSPSSSRQASDSQDEAIDREETSSTVLRSNRNWPSLDWWLPPTVVLFGAATLLYIWFVSTDTLDNDLKNIFIFSIGMGVLIAVTTWYLYRSNLSVRLRWGISIALLLLLLALFATFRIESVDGDMTLKFALRWSPRPDQLLKVDPPFNTGDLFDLPAGPEKEGSKQEVSVSTEPTPQDYPRYLGENLRSEIKGVRLATDWKKTPPKEIWRQRIGAGWSAFAVVGDVAITQEQRSEYEFVVAYAWRTGKVLWGRGSKTRFTSVMGGIGPRATPTIHEGKVYAVGAEGALVCLELRTGRLLWGHDLQEEFNGGKLRWGVSSSPLVVEDRVIVAVGGPEDNSVIALNKGTGEKIWGAGQEQISYASPELVVLCGEKQILLMVDDWLVSRALSSGKERWRFSWPGSSASNPSVSQAFGVADDRVFLSKGYGGGSALLKITRKDDQYSVKAIWAEPTRMKTKMTNVVLHEGYVYGLSGGILECIELETGRKMWKRGRYGHGQILLVGDLLLVLSESGNVLLVDASPNEFRQLAKLEHALEGKSWNPPVLVGRHLLIRNSEMAACYELPLAETDDTETPEQD